jgi:hypothetical protein
LKTPMNPGKAAAAAFDSIDALKPCKSEVCWS